MIREAQVAASKMGEAKIAEANLCQARLCQAAGCDAAVYEAAFGDATPAAAGAIEAFGRRPRWLRAQIFLGRIFRTTLRLTASISGRTPRRLHLRENLPLGERRFVAVVEFERTRFLVGGTPSSLVLLARLGNSSEAEATQASKQETECAYPPDAFVNRAAKADVGAQL